MVSLIYAFCPKNYRLLPKERYKLRTMDQKRITYLRVDT